MRHSHIWLQRRGRLKRWCGFVVRQISSRIVIIKSSLTNLVFQYSECSKTCACSVRRAAGRVATTVAATPVAAAVAAAVATSNRAPCQKKLWLCLRKNMCAVWLNVCPEGFYVCPEPSWRQPRRGDRLVLVINAILLIEGNAFGQALLTGTFARRHFRRSGTWHADAHQNCMGTCTFVLDSVIVVVDGTNTSLPP